MDTLKWTKNGLDTNPHVSYLIPRASFMKTSREVFGFRETKVDPISTEELLTHPLAGHETLRIHAGKMEGKSTFQSFQINKKSFLIRISTCNAMNIYTNLKRCVLEHLISYTVPDRLPPDVSEQHYTIRQTMYKPEKILNIQRLSHRYCDCGRDHFKLRTLRSTLKLSPETSQ